MAGVASIFGFNDLLALWRPHSRGIFTQRHEICSQETRGSRLSYGKNPESLSQLGLSRYRVVTDRRTDRQTDGLSRVKTFSVAV